MKTKFFGNWKAVLALAGLPLVAAAFLNSPELVAGGEPVPDGSLYGPDGGEGGVIISNQIVTGDAVPVVGAQPAAATLPDLKLTGGVQEVAKLAQSGVGENVMLAYITNTPVRFGLGPDQIIYLNDLGVTGPVITAMMEHDAAVPDLPAVSTATPATTMDQTDIATQMVDNTTADYQPGTSVDYTTYDPGTIAENDAGYFYNSLTPYGSWIYMAGYGLCWQPTVSVRSQDWRPYADRGRWLYTDCGWYWQSDYSWGWAAFHYGRWFQDEQRGWVWHPDRVWGPAWVSWRQSRELCGWAPLPPGAHFTPGIGLSFGGHPVGASFGFGLAAHNYTFMPIERLADYSPGRYSFAGTQAERAFHETAVVNQMGVTVNRRVFNRGVDPGQVEALAHTPVRRALVQVAPRDGDRHAALADRLEKHGDSLVMLRPPLPAPPGRDAGANRGSSFNPVRDFGAPRTAFNNLSAPATAQPVMGAPTPSAPEPRPRVNVHVRGDASQVSTGVAAATETRSGYPRNSIVMVGGRNLPDPNENTPKAGITASPTGRGLHVTVREPLPLDPPPVAYQPADYGSRFGRPTSEEGSQRFDRSARNGNPATDEQEAAHSRGNFNRGPANQFSEATSPRSANPAPPQNHLLFPPSHAQAAESAPVYRASPSYQSAPMLPPSHSQAAPAPAPASAPAPAPASPPPSHSSAPSSSSSSSSSSSQSGRR